MGSENEPIDLAKLLSRGNEPIDLSNPRLSTQIQWDMLAIVFDLYNEIGAGKEIRDQYYDPPVLNMLGDVSGLTVLDAGCGNGRFTEKFAKYARSVIGLDSSNNMIHLAQKREIPNTNFQVSDILEPFPLEDESVDAAVLHLVLPYVPSLPEPAAELYRVLRPGGRVVISVDHPDINDFYYHQGINPDHYDVLPPKKEGATSRRKLGRLAKVTVFHTQLETYHDFFRQAGFRHTAFDAPVITPAVAQIHPSYEPHIGIPRIAVMEYTKK